MFTSAGVDMCNGCDNIYGKVNEKLNTIIHSIDQNFFRYHFNFAVNNTGYEYFGPQLTDQ